MNKILSKQIDNVNLFYSELRKALYGIFIITTLKFKVDFNGKNNSFTITKDKGNKILIIQLKVTWS